jgi:hypothetical protein
MEGMCGLRIELDKKIGKIKTPDKPHYSLKDAVNQK